MEGCICLNLVTEIVRQWGRLLVDPFMGAGNVVVPRYFLVMKQDNKAEFQSHVCIPFPPPDPSIARRTS